MGKFLDITNSKFGRLLVLYRADSNTLKPHWVCKCECGTIVEVSGASLKSGNTKSCGCYNLERLTSHGSHKTALYAVWCGMKKRCNVPTSKSYVNYGGRGITYTPDWEHFIPFKEWALSNGYQKDLQRDRINNDKHYTPCNCRWTTPTIQQRNRRKLKGASKFIGVSWDSRRTKWIAHITINNRAKYLGQFTDEKEAAQCRDNYIKENNLPGFNLNKY